MNMLIKTLMEFGLSEKEAGIYLALLELEVAGVGEIAKKSGVNRSSAYVVIESLKKKGLVSMSADKKKQEYVAISPDIVLQMAEERTKKYADIQKKVVTLVPELKALHKDTRHTPKVLVYEGEESVKKALYEFSPMNFDDDLRVYENPTEMNKRLPGFIETDCIQRIKKGIKMYAINPDTKEVRKIKAKYKIMGSPDEVMLIPANKFKLPKIPIDFAVYGDESSFTSLQESFAIVIKNQEIADTLKNIFDLAFKEAGRLAKKS